MRAVKTTGHVDERGRIHLDQPLANVNGRVEIIVLIDDTDPDLLVSKEEIVTNFRQAWREAMNGQTVPVSQIWEGIEHSCDCLSIA